ncbi:hypothetical protein E2C01_081707 [Portunus trituberculatus]|uniref:Secreted protein n=1 Tax=Portunus trituberculatus TaxID=210409 RepID=A0A5B7IQH1_PORTR|nr:hypothetical protein [Portunus trituberculatus]
MRSERCLELRTLLFLLRLLLFPVSPLLLLVASPQPATSTIILFIYFPPESQLTTTDHSITKVLFTKQGQEKRFVTQTLL